MPTLFQWIVIGAVIFVIFVFVKFRYIKHKLTWIFILLIILLLYIGFLTSMVGHNIDLKTYSGGQTAIKLYLVWLGNSFNNMKTLTGEAVKLDWGTNTTIIKEKIRPG